MGKYQHECDYQMAIANQAQEIERLNQKLALFQKVAKSVIARWDTPLWKDAPATAIFINELRAVSDGAISTKLWMQDYDQQVRDKALDDASEFVKSKSIALGNKADQCKDRDDAIEMKSWAFAYLVTSAELSAMKGKQ